MSEFTEAEINAENQIFSEAAVAYVVAETELKKVGKQVPPDLDKIAALSMIASSAKKALAVAGKHYLAICEQEERK